jgi:hypothetical protein
MEKENVEMMPPQKTWFFEDSTGRIFPANEKEAFSLLTENSRWRRQDIKMIGMSDGTTYHQMVRDSKAAIPKLREELTKLTEERDKLIRGHDRLMFEEFVDAKDPRIVRAKKLIKEADKKIAPLEDELKELRTNIVNKAYAAELEKARGNIVLPRDYTVTAFGDGTSTGKAALDAFVNSKRRL